MVVALSVRMMLGVAHDDAGSHTRMSKQVLLHANANVNHASSKGSTALTEAAGKGHTTTIQVGATFSWKRVVYDAGHHKHLSTRPPLRSWRTSTRLLQL